MNFDGVFFVVVWTGLLDLGTLSVFHFIYLFLLSGACLKTIVTGLKKIFEYKNCPHASRDVQDSKNKKTQTNGLLFSMSRNIFSLTHIFFIWMWFFTDEKYMLRRMSAINENKRAKYSMCSMVQ